MSLDSKDDSYWAKKAELVFEKLLERIPENKLRPRLDPTRRAVQLLGDPQKSYRVIHITGTNGKTSTTRFIERILREHGIKTGRFTSPHLIKLNERIAIDGEPVSDERLFEVYTDIEPVLEFVDQELLGQGEVRLTFFEALAVLAFAIFADAPIDVLVLEVGMGGEWDSTNVADGDVAVFTPIGLDHMDRLGNTVEEIAKTKSGIIKPGAIVISAKQEQSAMKVLEEVAKSKADSLKVLGEDFAVLQAIPTPSGQQVRFSGLAGNYGTYSAPVFGEHQAENLAVAIAAVEAFLGGGEVPLADDILRSAIADVSSPGRLQLVKTNPAILLDGAHNPHGCRTLALSLRSQFGESALIGIISVLSDKDVAAVLAELHGIFDAVIFTQSSSPRASSPDELSQLALPDFAPIVELANDLSSALARARELATDLSAMIVVTGSITLVGDALARLQQEEQDA